MWEWCCLDFFFLRLTGRTGGAVSSSDSSTLKRSGSYVISGTCASVPAVGCDNGFPVNGQKL